MWVLDLAVNGKSRRRLPRPAPVFPSLQSLVPRSVIDCRIRDVLPVRFGAELIMPLHLKSTELSFALYQAPVT